MNGLSRPQTGSRFTGRAIAALPEQPRRASPQDILSRVPIRIVGEAAGDALEYRLALAAQRVDDSTGGTRLAGMAGIDADQHASPFGKLIFELRGKGSPPLFVDRSVQTALARAGRGHVLDPQILNGDGAEAVSEVAAYTMLPVTANARDLSTQLGYAAKLSHFPPLGHEVEEARIVAPVVTPLFEAEIEYKSRRPRKLRQRLGLRRRRVKPMSKRAVDHAFDITKFALVSQGFHPLISAKDRI